MSNNVEVTFAERAELEKVVVLNVLDGHNGGLTPVPLPREEAARVLELNCRMERTSYIGHGTMIGRFLDAYAYIVPETTVGWAWSQLYEVLSGALHGIEVDRLDVPKTYRPETVDVIIENVK